MEQKPLVYPLTIYVKEGSGNIDQLVINIIEHSIDYKKQVFTYTDELFQLGFIPLDNILRMVFGKELFDISLVTFPAYKETTAKILIEQQRSDSDGKRFVSDERMAGLNERLLHMDKIILRNKNKPISDERMRQCWVGYRKAGRIINRFNEWKAQHQC